MNKRMKLIALAMVVVMSVTMLASCQGGLTYADNSGNTTFLDMVEKDDLVSVPWEGGTPVRIEKTTDPQYAPSNGGSSENGGSDDNGGSGENGGTGDNGDNGGTGDNGGGGDIDESSPYANDNSGTPLTLMSQNLRVSGNLTDAGSDGTNNTVQYRQHRFRELVKKYSPDVIATQEVNPVWIGALTDTVCKDGYDMYYEYRATSSREGTPVLWKKDKYEVIEAGHFWWSKTPDVSSNSYGEEGIPARICCFATLKDKSTGVQFSFYSAHFGLGGGERVSGAGNQIANMFQAMPKGSYAFVLGDYNTAYQSQEYGAFVDDLRITDLRDVASNMAADGHCELGDFKGGTMPSNWSDAPFVELGVGGQYIDHLMAKPNAKLAVDFFGYLYDTFEVPSENVPMGYVSDHFALLCKVRLGTSVSYADYYGTTA